MKQDRETFDSDWQSLYRIGGVAALLAGILFRRNIAAEIGLFSAPPATISEWFALLQSHRLLGLAYLNFFDLVNYMLVGLMFLALYVVLKREHPSYMTIAMTLGGTGIAVYFAANTALSMLALSSQYAAASTEAQKTMVLAAGQAMLALNRFSTPGAHPGGAGYLSLFLIAVAGMLISVMMLRSTVFSRATAYVGIVACALDLAYCIAYVLLPTATSEVVALCCIPAAGLLLMLWHILIGRRLYQLGNRNAA